MTSKNILPPGHYPRSNLILSLLLLLVVVVEVVVVVVLVAAAAAAVVVVVQCPWQWVKYRAFTNIEGNDISTFL